MSYGIEKREGGEPSLPTLTHLRADARAEKGLLSPPMEVRPFERAVLSWNADGRWRFDLRVRIGGKWSPWRVMGHMDGERQWSGAEKSNGGPVAVQTDILTVRGGKTADAFQVRAEGAGTLRALSVAHFRDSARDPAAAPSPAWGVVLPVPERSQTVEDPAIRSSVCSPTSVAMVLDYYGLSLPTVEVARRVFDQEARIYGNWPINAATAARLLSGWAAVAKLGGFADVEREIAARRPVVLSHRWRAGDLSNAPIRQSAGHLIVVVGFTEQGDVVVNDPAAKPGQVRRVYRRAELFRTWQVNADGIVYLIRPERA